MKFNFKKLLKIGLKITVTAAAAIAAWLGIKVLTDDKKDEKVVDESEGENENSDTNDPNGANDPPPQEQPQEVSDEQKDTKTRKIIRGLGKTQEIGFKILSLVQLIGQGISTVMCIFKSNPNFENTMAPSNSFYNTNPNYQYNYYSQNNRPESFYVNPRLGTMNDPYKNPWITGPLGNNGARYAEPIQMPNGNVWRRVDSNVIEAY